MKPQLTEEILKDGIVLTEPTDQWRGFSSKSEANRIATHLKGLEDTLQTLKEKGVNFTLDFFKN